MIRNINKKLFSLASDFSVSDIHELSLRILKEIGVPVTSKKAQEVLYSSGCKVDKAGNNVFVPEDVVVESLKKVAPEYGLYNRNGFVRIAIGGNNIAFLSDAAAIRIKDLEGVYREPTLEDLGDMTRVQDSLVNVDVIHELVEPGDIGTERFRVKMAAELLKNSTKPCAFVVEGPDDVEAIHRMGSVIRGSEKELAEKPLFSIHDISAEATIGIVEEQCEALMKCVELGIPTGLGSYPIMGSTGPVTLKGSLALANANILFALVIAQTICPGIPFLYMIMAGSMDMRRAEMVTASSEIWAYYLAGRKMARLYSLPSHCIISADSKLTDIQLAIEKFSALFIAVLSGMNLIHGSVCQSDGMNGANFEQILIDNEIISMIKHMMDVFQPDQWESDTSEIFEDIKKSLTSGMYFMESDTTLRDFKKRLWMSDLLIRQNFDRWQAEGMRSIIDNSIDRTRDILKNHEVEPLDKKVKKELEQIAGV
jgi:trimethylamine--corrinoid protein Co-methyltransferase